jgi:hypothetical protein
MVSVDGFFSTIKAALGIPMGTSWRKGYGVSSTNNGISDNDLSQNAYAEAICDITADDVCRGETPVSYNYELPEGVEELPEAHQSVLDSFKDELNSVVRWVSKDLQLVGVSVFNATFDKEENKICLLPNLRELKYYLTKTKRVVAYDMTEAHKEKRNLEDVIIFINYEKNSLIEVPEDNKDLDNKDIIYEITPTPMQFKNAKGTLDALNLIENALKRYRAQLSRIVRYATVDVGLSSGDVQKDVVETIAAAINADSMDLTSTNNEEFNDNIPVIPTRNGKGAPEMHIDSAQGQLTDLPDLKYYLDKLNLITRFPATYMDFSQAMGTTAASMIRSDLRYAKLCNSIRTLIEKTINEFISRTQSLEQYNVVFSLIQLPTSEDDDVLQAMSNYTDVVGDIEDLVMGDDEEEDIERKIHRLKSLLGLVNASIKSPVIQDWYNSFLDYLEELRQKKQGGATEEGEEGEEDGGGFGGGDFGGGDEDFGGGGGLEDLGEPDFTGEDLGGGGEEPAPEIETFESQTE